MVTGRLVAAVEVAVFAASILTFIWWLEPLEDSRIEIAFYLYIFALAFGSNVLHHDSRRSLGLRLDTFAQSFRDVGGATVLAVAILLLAGWALGSLERPRVSRAASSILSYVGWALMQQYALQGVVVQRLRDAGLGRRTPPVAAALFSLMHAPNPGLMALTFIGGWIWCASFLRAPNLFVLALSHASVALVASLALPASLTGGLRVGPGYLRFLHR